MLGRRLRDMDTSLRGHHAPSWVSMEIVGRGNGSCGLMPPCINSPELCRVGGRARSPGQQPLHRARNRDQRSATAEPGGWHPGDTRPGVPPMAAGPSAQAARTFAARVELAVRRRLSVLDQQMAVLIHAPRCLSSPRRTRAPLRIDSVGAAAARPHAPGGRRSCLGRRRSATGRTPRASTNTLPTPLRHWLLARRVSE